MTSTGENLLLKVFTPFSPTQPPTKPSPDPNITPDEGSEAAHNTSQMLRLEPISGDDRIRYIVLLPASMRVNEVRPHLTREPLPAYDFVSLALKTAEIEHCRAETIYCVKEKLWQAYNELALSLFLTPEILKEEVERSATTCQSSWRLDISTMPTAPQFNKSVEDWGQYSHGLAMLEENAGRSDPAWIERALEMSLRVDLMRAVYDEQRARREGADIQRVWAMFAGRSGIRSLDDQEAIEFYTRRNHL
ncbi:MAG: hypothetical protein Q9162_005530 [Coniocarpon cinnabarinum]